MRKTKASTLFGFFFSILLITSNQLVVAQTEGKIPGPEDYDKWERLGRYALSDNGKYLAYQVNKNNKEYELILVNLELNEPDSLGYGSNPYFTEDGKYFFYYINPDAESTKQMRNNGEIPGKDLAIHNLESDELQIIENVSSYEISSSSQYLAISFPNSNGSDALGTDIAIMNLESWEETNLGNVAEYAWSEQGNLLALILETEARRGNAVQLFDAEESRLKTLDKANSSYLGLTWREDSRDLAVFRSSVDSIYEDSTHHILVWKDLAGLAKQAQEFSQENFKNFPKDMRLLSQTLGWSKGGESLFFDLKSWEQKQDKDSLESMGSAAPGIQIWHSKDVDIIPAQELARRPMHTYLSVWHIDTDKFVQLENELIDDISYKEDVQTLIGADSDPYNLEAMFGRPNKDYYTVDIRSGKAHKFLEKCNHVYGVSPDGNQVVYLKNDNFHVYNFKAGTHTNVSKGLEASFVNQDDDHPVAQKPIYRYWIIGWAENSQSFFVHSKYDIWQIQADGSGGKALTNGKDKKIIYRHINTDFEAEYIDPTQRIYASKSGEWSKESGYVSLMPGKKEQEISWGTFQHYRLRKAKKSEALVFSKETFSQSPNFYYSEKGDKKQKKVSDINAFQKDFAWGKSELIEYKNADGKRLQGVLFYPANYEAGKKYPMITYIYERLSQRLNQYMPPSNTNYYNHTVFTHHGYFVLMPDIIFTEGEPGISSAKTIEIAVKKALESGMIDAEKVGLVGHSWGGYQAGFVPTQTDIFAAAVSGAGLMNLISMYGTVTRAFGGNLESDHFETSQERMGVNPWQDPDRYLRNSPIMQIENLNTPMLVEVGDNDQNVSWTQGIEFYNAARRHGKQCVMISYANEGHGLRQEKNQRDYQRRILAWFGHYLKGEEAEDWILSGIPLEEQNRRLKNWKE